MRIAVLGLYNSGSTAIAGMLHRLGVNMGPPFWLNSNDDSPENHYEAPDLSHRLRKWWDEPLLVERTSSRRRVCYLRRWIARQERSGAPAAGAKHPLLSLCGQDLLAAWGESARLVWCHRPLADSISGLQKREWFKGREAEVQQRLWGALCDLERSGVKISRIEWDRVKSDPNAAVNELVNMLGIRPPMEKFELAANFIRA
jgi:hypothetical protein